MPSERRCQWRQSDNQCRPAQNRVADPDRTPGTDPDAVAQWDPEPNAGRAPNRHPDVYGGGERHPDRHRNPDIVSYRNAAVHRNTGGDPHGDARTDGDPHDDAGADGDRHGRGERHADENSNQPGDSHTHRHGGALGDRKRDIDGDSDRDGHTHQ